MKLGAMSFKGFVWPNNPASCSVEAIRTVAVKKLAGGGWYTRDMGLEGRTIAGGGEFSGSNAYSSFMELYSVFCSDGAGELYHPVIGTVQAVFESLKMTQKPAKDYVAYSFVFRQCGNEDKNEVSDDVQMGWYTLGAGESFWTVCRKFALTAGELLELNPSVSNPADLESGDRVRVS